MRRKAPPTMVGPCDRLVASYLLLHVEQYQAALSAQEEEEEGQAHERRVQLPGRLAREHGVALTSPGGHPPASSSTVSDDFRLDDTSGLLSCPTRPPT